jgi:7-keto-8-aminopelargonate synthetase-like enzyme
MGKESALLFSTGFQVNQGVIAPLVGHDTYVFYDRFDHASIIDGVRLAFGRAVRFEHNDMESLRNALAPKKDKPKLIVVDGVFSMEGDIAKLPDIVALAEEYEAEIMVDDAHAIGVLGPHGEGTAAHFGLNDKVDLIMGTFSKSLASIGGFIAGSDDFIHFIKHHSRAFIFSASPPPASVASVIKALEIMQREPERMERLWANTKRLHQGLKQLGFNTRKAETPILPVLVGDNLKVFRMCKRLHEEGLFVNPVISPAVQEGDQLIRLSLMATHTFEQIDFALEKLALVGRELELIN